jgi:predicted hotdog family 3-hydroxylacyl-ACP dehydratase
LKLDHHWIAAHIPHQGRMCLLDEVLEWDRESIRCRSGSHRAADHPLRAHGRLGSACSIEYAAQSMAVHEALCAGVADVAGHPPAPGRLTSARAVTMHVDRLDDIAGDLIIAARRQGQESGLLLYRFRLSPMNEATRVLVEGRAAVLLPS